MSTSQLDISSSVSANTQAILLLTAPLIAGRGESSKDLLTVSEYGKLARFLSEAKRQPADLITADGSELFVELGRIVNSDRMKRLMGRGFLLSQAIDRWQTRAIWVVGRTDEEYPPKLKERLKDVAPPILYGCGAASLLNSGGLAVAGSRHADESVIDYATETGELAARSKCTIISGGARGVDQAAMTGALVGGGKAAGVLADSLERSALNREHRNYLRNGELVLISPYDPLAGFNVGNAMQRNKLIYALADAALVIQSDYGKGGTWAGAIEQLEKLRLVPVYTYVNTKIDTALEALRKKGALPWPNPTTPEAFIEAVAVGTNCSNLLDTEQLSFSENSGENPDKNLNEEKSDPADTVIDPLTMPPGEQLFATVRSLLQRLDAPKTEKEIADELMVSTRQVKQWLRRLVEEGVLEKLSAPTRYRSRISMRLF